MTARMKTEGLTSYKRVCYTGGVSLER